MFHPPPADLSGREPLFHVASTTELWYRSHRVGNSPIYFGKSQTHRWDSPDGDFGVLYLGRTVIQCGDIPCPHSVLPDKKTVLRGPVGQQC
jgi:hypothetical protein